MEGRSDSNGLACISPDINLIENLWDLPSACIEVCQPEPQDLFDLWATVHEEGIAIPQQSINTSLNSTRLHFQAVIDSRGHMTQYRDSAIFGF